MSLCIRRSKASVDGLHSTSTSALRSRSGLHIFYTLPLCVFVGTLYVGQHVPIPPLSLCSATCSWQTLNMSNSLISSSSCSSTTLERDLLQLKPSSTHSLPPTHALHIMHTTPRRAREACLVRVPPVAKQSDNHTNPN